MRWFRLYTDILDDPKCNVSNMLHETFRVFVLLMAYASELDKGGVIHREDDPAWRLRITPETLSTHLKTLSKLGIITEENGDITFTNWNKRQFESDNSTPRVKRFRNGKRNVSVTADETAPDTDTESESDTDKGLKASAAKTDPVEESPQPSKPEKTYPQEVHTLCKTLADLIAARDPKFKVKGLNEWLSEMDRLIRIDGRTPEEIEKVIRWAQSDSFWHRNILSVDKLRKQFPRLLLDMQAAGRPGNGKNATRYEKNMAAIQSVLDECESQKGTANGNAGNLLEIPGHDGDSFAGQDDQPGVHEVLPGNHKGNTGRGVF